MSSRIPSFQDLFVQRWPPQGKPRAAIALIHGFGEHSGRYGELIESLTAHGYEVWTVDLPGHGRSPGKRGHISHWDDYRRTVQRLLDEIRREHPELPLFLYGHSMGGLIVLDFGLRHPAGLRGVIASAPALTFTAPWFARPLARAVSRVWPGFTAHSGLEPDGLSRSSEYNAAYLEDPLLHDRISARLLTEMDRVGAETRRDAAHWTLPLLLLHGDADRVVPIWGTQEFFRRLEAPDRTFWVLPGGYHEPHHDLDSDAVIADILLWLDTRLDATAPVREDRGEHLRISGGE